MIFGALLHFSHEMEQNARKNPLGAQWISTRTFHLKKLEKLVKALGLSLLKTMWVIIHY